MRSLWAVGFMMGVAGVATAEPVARPTFYKDVLPILQENCQACHRPGGANLGGMVAPMALVAFEETRPWAKAMAKAVASREMPPWDAAPHHTGVFANERSLTQDEIDTLVAWAESGARKGDPGDAPEAREWPDFGGWSIGEPDLVLTFDEPYFVKDDVEDEYVYLTTTITEEMLPEDKYIKAVEFRPGSKVVHHIIAFPLGGIAPGNEPTVHPDGVGQLFKKGTDLTWEMHYHKEPGPGTGVTDRSSAAIIFYDDPSDVKYVMQGNDLGRYDFAIPPGASDYSVTAEYTFKHDSRIVQLMPHFHLRGKSAKYDAYYPDGTHEVLLEIPRYDFNWQTAYAYKDFKEIPKGTRVVFTTVWDNSADNPYNPDPTKRVYYGEPTTDEMSYGYISFINDSDDTENFFDNLTGASGTIDLTALMYAYDDNHDRMLQKEEAPAEFQGYFAMMDFNKDGNFDAEEATRAQEQFAAFLAPSESGD